MATAQIAPHGAGASSSAQLARPELGPPKNFTYVTLLRDPVS